MRFQFAKCSRLCSNEADMRRMLARYHQRKTYIRETKQRPGGVLILHFALKAVCVPIDGGGNVRNRDCDVIDCVQVGHTLMLTGRLLVALVAYHEA
jgi:hypothetical protein